MIKIKQLNKYYGSGAGHIHVLKDLDLEIHEGELVSIMGSSGSGKSTLLNIMGILDQYDSGEYLLDNTLIKNLDPDKAARFRNLFLGFVFQSFNLLAYKNALENVALPLYYRDMSQDDRKELAMQYLAKVGLQDRATHLPSELSGGQQQRVAIARALVTAPKLVLADEPTGALDSQTSEEIMKLLKEINSEGKTIIIVTHEQEVAEQTQRIIRLKDGRVT